MTKYRKDGYIDQTVAYGGGTRGLNGMGRKRLITTVEMKNGNGETRWSTTVKLGNTCSSSAVNRERTSGNPSGVHVNTRFIKRWRDEPAGGTKATMHRQTVGTRGEKEKRAANPRSGKEKTASKV